jgi:hypothetical protein
MARAFTLILLAVLAIAVTGCGASDTSKPQPTATTNAKLCPKDAAASKSFDANTLLGLTLVKARAEAVKYRCEVRPVSVDGRKLANVQDVRTDRVNVALEKGRISEVLGVY